MTNKIFAQGRGKCLVLYLLLQLYLAGNVLSFGFWKADAAIWGHMVVFYGTWLTALPCC